MGEGAGYFSGGAGREIHLPRRSPLGDRESVAELGLLLARSTAALTDRSHRDFMAEVRLSSRAALALGGVLLLRASGAQAGGRVLDSLDYFLSPGVVWSWTGSPERANGPGFEISAGYQPIWNEPVEEFPLIPTGVGVFYRGQSYDADDGDFGRRTIGAEVLFVRGFFGVELGYAWRDGFAGIDDVHGVHASPFASVGVLYFGPQWLIPASGFEDAEIAWNLGLKFPLPHSIVLPMLAVALG
jgi:hypothetical protein